MRTFILLILTKLVVGRDRTRISLGAVYVQCKYLDKPPQKQMSPELLEAESLTCVIDLRVAVLALESLRDNARTFLVLSRGGNLASQGA